MHCTLHTHTIYIYIHITITWNMNNKWHKSDLHLLFAINLVNKRRHSLTLVLLVVCGKIIQTFVLALDLFRFVITIYSTIWFFWLQISKHLLYENCIVLCNRNSIQRIFSSLHCCFLFENQILSLKKKKNKNKNEMWNEKWASTFYTFLSEYVANDLSGLREPRLESGHCDLIN